MACWTLYSTQYLGRHPFFALQAACSGLCAAGFAQRSAGRIRIRRTTDDESVSPQDATPRGTGTALGASFQPLEGILS